MLRRLDYTPYPYEISEVKLIFELDPVQTFVKGSFHVTRKPGVPSDQSFILHIGEQVVLHGLELDGRPLAPTEYVRANGELMIPSVPEKFFFQTSVEINPSENHSGQGLFLTDGMFCTQCEAEGFRHITPYPDRPDVLASIKTCIVAEKARYPILLSNGNPLPISYLVFGEGKHAVVWDDPARKPCYLFALIAGDLVVLEDAFVTMSGREVSLRLYSDTAETLAKCHFAVESLKKAMRWDEEVFGREYDIDLYMIVAVSSFNMGAMENRGLNVFNLAYVSGTKETATDDRLIAIESVVAHEYFHNWTGNLVTVCHWFEISLKEGLTVFRDQEFTRESWGISAVIDAVNVLRTRQFAEDAGPLAHPIRPDEAEDISNFYTLTVYEKSAEVFRMQRTILGAKDFRKGMDCYFARHFGQPATCDDFVAAMEDASGHDLMQFRLWYSQAGTPEVTVRYLSYDRVSGCVELEIDQSCPPTPGQPTKAPLHIPLRIGFLDANGNDMPARLVSFGCWEESTGVLHLIDRSARYRFHVGIESAPPVLSLNRGFSAPVKMRYERSEKECAFLMLHDTDDFARWDAGQELALRVLTDLARSHSDAHQDHLPSSYFVFMGAFQKVFRKGKHYEIAGDLYAEMLTLPSEQAIANACDVVDPVAIHHAREFLRHRIAREGNAELFAKQYREHCAPYAFDRESVTRRKIKNVCLGYLGFDVQLAQFARADNMTDEVAALAELINAPERTADPKCAALATAALQGFFEKHKDDRNVVDMWFGLQARCVHTDADGIRALMKHPEFSLRVPNRVYAVIRAFASGNPTQFHHVSGSGYSFLADMILEIDQFNPHVAAVLVDPLTEWKRYDPARQQLMKEQLMRLRGHALSLCVMEKIEKGLA